MNEIKLPSFKPGCEPKFRIGDTVWVIKDRRVQQVQIFGINYTEVAERRGKEHVLMTRGYETNAYSDLVTGDRSFLPWQIIADEAEAHRLATWHPVSGLTDSQWLTVTEDILDDSELPDGGELSACFSEIESAQRLFITCRDDGGLIQRDTECLEQIIKRDGRTAVPGPNIKNVLAQLGLTWPGTPTEG